METRLRERFAAQMSRGDLILFTGAGFSLSATSRSGQHIPSVKDLRELLWPIAFPGIQIDNESSLGEVFQCALNTAGGRVRQTMQTALDVDPSSLPECYRTWFSMPWKRVYTLNVDNLEVASEVAFQLRRRFLSISALRDGLPDSETDRLLYTHLNGRISEFPEITFSPRNYAERSTGPDPWYQFLIADLASHPIVFVGTVLEESLLWNHIEYRRNRSPRSKEMRPGSYLVTPKISTARRVMLRNFNVDWIEMTQEEFAANVLEGMAAERAKGMTAIQNRDSLGSNRSLLRRVAELRQERNDGSAEFLLGREPSWYDITEGVAIRRQFEDELRSRIDGDKPQVIVLTGTAGSGKSTTLRRLALEFQSEGRDIAWMDLDYANFGVRQIVDRVADTNPDGVAIDDSDVLGSSIGPLLRTLANASPDRMIVAAMRSTRFERFDVENHLKEVRSLIYPIPHLGDSDINGLIEALTSANRLGKLRGLSRPQQVQIFKSHAGRQLLVAMIEVTSGERFDEKVDDECQQLESRPAFIYATVAIATSLRSYLTRDNIMLATGDATNQTLNDIESLIRQRLMVRNQNEIRVRHRVIADRVIDYYRKQGQLAEPIQGLLWTMASRVHASAHPQTRENRLLRHLMNHEFMINITSDNETPRRAYENVERLLEWNSHYWLQRGSYEVEAGDIDLAKNFIEQARAMAPDDNMVQTEWAYMTLKRASANAAAGWARESAGDAISELEDAIDRRGKTDDYPYHVLGSQGLSWSRKAVISQTQKRELLERLLHHVRRGLLHHPRSSKLQQIESDLKKEYLMTVVDD